MTCVRSLEGHIRLLTLLSVIVFEFNVRDKVPMVVTKATSLKLFQKCIDKQIVLLWIHKGESDEPFIQAMNIAAVSDNQSFELANLRNLCS